MKSIIPVLALFLLLLNCTSSNNPLNNHIEYLKTKIDKEISSLKNKVEETGLSPAGKKYIMIADSSKVLIENAIKKIEQSGEVSKAEINNIARIVNNRYDSIKIDTSFLNTSLESYKNNLDKDIFTLSLLLINLDIIEGLEDSYQKFFYCFDLVKPIVIANKYKIKKGEFFEGSAVLESKLVGMKILYEIDDPQTKEGFVSVPAYARNNRKATIKIEGITTGKHQIKMRATQPHNGKLAAFESEFELEVLE